MEKNPHISGPTQFEPMLFKGQLYILVSTILKVSGRKMFSDGYIQRLSYKVVPLSYF